MQEFSLTIISQRAVFLKKYEENLFTILHRLIKRQNLPNECFLAPYKSKNPYIHRTQQL